MPRIHYPKGIRTSRALRARRWAGGRRIPRRGCPFFTKAHGALTRRSGESCVSVPRVRRRPAHHGPNRSRRDGSRRSRAARVASSSESGSGDTVPEGLRLLGSSRGCFQRGTSVVKALPPRVPGRCQPPRPASIAAAPRHPGTWQCGFTEGLRVSQPEPSHLSGLSGDSICVPTPSPTTSQVCEGPAVHPVTRYVSWLVQLSEPCSAL